MDTWHINYKAHLRLEKYVVNGYRLYNDSYYGPDGMWDKPEKLPLNEYELEIASWYTVGIGKTKYAGPHSPIRMKMTFKDRDLANKAWAILKTLEPDYDALEFMGFKNI